MSTAITQQSLYEAMRTAFAERAGFRIEDDDDLAVRLWAVAAQLAALYTESAWCERQAFPQTADGIYLDYHGQMRAMTRRGGTQAQGTLRMYLENPLLDDVPITADTVCTDAGLVRFVTTQAAVIPAGTTYVDVPARAELPGRAGNAAPGTICFLHLPPQSVSGVTNPAAFTGGMDAEDDESFRARILDSYRRLPNGANAAWYELRTLEIDGVAAVSVLPRWQGIGTVGVVITDGDGPASAALVAQVQAELDSAREIATDVTVMAAEAVTIPVMAEIKVADGYDPGVVLLAVRTAIEQFFNGQLLAKPLYRATLGQVIYAVDGVENYQLTLPAADVAISNRQTPVLGALSVTEAEQ